MRRWVRGAMVAVAVAGIVVTGCVGKNKRVAIPAEPQATAAAPKRTADAAVTTLAAIERRGQLKVILDWSNPSFIDLNDVNGFAFELSQRIAQTIFGGKVKAEFVHSLVRPRDLQRGDGDLLLDTWQPTGEELKTFHISPPYYTDSARLLVWVHSDISKIEQVDGKTVAQIVNTSWNTPPDRLPDYFKQTHPNLSVNFKGFTFFKDGVDAVLRRDVAAVSGPTSELAKFAKKGSSVRILPEQYGTWTYGAVVLKQNAELAAAVDKAIQQMTESGELAQLVKKWGLDI